MNVDHCAIYSQSTGSFSIFEPGDDGVGRIVCEFFGYAGNGEGRNNPDAEHIRNVGPLPKGIYQVARSITSVHHGPLVFRLWPNPRNRMYGRSGFLIHGDNARGDASRGCIILARPARQAVEELNVRSLCVTG